MISDNRSRFVYALAVASALLIMLLSSYGCSVSSESDLGVAETIEEEDTAFNNPLSGSCAKGLACDTPTCGSWVDRNNDGQCDRGIEN